MWNWPHFTKTLKKQAPPTTHLSDHDVAASPIALGNGVVQQELGDLGGLATPSVAPDDHHTVLLHCSYNVRGHGRDRQLLAVGDALEGDGTKSQSLWNWSSFLK